MDLKLHPATAIFPPMEPDEFNAFVADIREHGVREPITLFDGQVLDGRHRLRAALLAGVECPTREYTGNDPHAYVLSLNLHRRQLTPTQSALAAYDYMVQVEAERARQRQRGGPGGLLLPDTCPEAKGEAREKAGKAFGVSGRTVSRVREVVDAAPDLVEDMRNRRLTLQDARREIARRKRDARCAANAAKVATTPPLDLLASGAKFSTVVIDPPWKYDAGSDEDGNLFGRAAPDYATMPFDQIANLPIGRLADENAHLYLWITNRSLPMGFGLLEQWGFRYITLLTWCKPSYGIGYYFRGQTEHVLFGVRGSLPLKRRDVGTLFKAPAGAWFEAARGPLGHSSKPLEFYELVEACSPGPHLEVFSRQAREGWTSWGADAPGVDGK